jgi:hypothetical protein
MLSHTARAGFFIDDLRLMIFGFSILILARVLGNCSRLSNGLSSFHGARRLIPGTG